MFNQLTQAAQRIHEHNVSVGWWDKWIDNKPARYDTALFLVITELAEAGEGVRKDLMDDKLPHYKMLHVELADTLIRLLDLAGAMEINFDADRHFEDEYHYAVGDMVDCDNDLERLLCVVRNVSVATDRYDLVVLNGVAWTLAMVTAIELDLNDFMIIMNEKHEFNKNRPDHKRENRAKANGKKF